MKNNGLPISAITLGTWVFGGKFWGGVNERECIDAVLFAVENDINCIDTAPIYGSGKSEIIVGKALQKLKAKRDRLIIATKCGLTIKGPKILHDLSPESVQRELELSLKRLQTDYIDLYQCHWPDENIPIEKTLETLQKFQREGKIRHIGLSNYSVDLFQKACRQTSIATSQNQYSLLDRLVEKDLLPFLKENFIGLLAYGPLAGGILTGKYKKAPHFQSKDVRQFFYKYYEGEAFKNTERLVSRLKEFERPLNQLAINWVRQRPGVQSVIVGCRNPRQVEQNVQALKWDLSKEELEKIETIKKDWAQHEQFAVNR